MKPVSLSEIESFFGVVAEKKEPDFILEGFASIEKVTPSDVSFFNSSIVSSSLKSLKAGLLFVPKNYEDTSVLARAFMRVDNPYQSMISFIEHFHIPFISFPSSKMASTAVIHPSAIVEGVVGEHCQIGPGCVVSKGAFIGDKTILEANVTVYPNVIIGSDCIIQAGVVIGSRGFGFYEFKNERFPVPHVSGVRIGNSCEFGANMVVASGFLSPTVIGNECHFDSFVQIGHNCTLGNRIYMASQSGLGGSTIVEDDVELAGGAQVAGHLTIGKGARVAAKAGVTKNVATGATVAGFPAIDIDIWRREVIAIRQKAMHKKSEI